jgi:putative transposase
MRTQGGLSIQRMCELADVSRASFYRHWEQREPSAAEAELPLGHRYYGYCRIAVLLKREGVVVGAKKVRRLMRQDNLLAIRRRKFVVTTDSDHTFEVYPNLAEHLELTDMNQLWVADLTYVRLESEFVYLAVVLDAYSRRVIGWAASRAMDTELVLEALEKAITSRQPQPGLVHHSDRGSQYASAEYVDRLEKCGAVLSMSRPGRPWENGRCESFIKTLKQEQLDGSSYETLEGLLERVEEFIDTVYNPVRLHSALAYQSPITFEQRRAREKQLVAWLPAKLSFLRHREISSDAQITESPGSTKGSPKTHRSEFPAGYSSAGCSPAEPVSASPAGLVLPQESPSAKEVAANGDC